jgi:hypothetical protein
MRFPGRDFVILLIACVLAAGLATGGRAADRFLSAIDDLPLMAQLEEIPESAVVYSKPQGRIVEVAARGKVAGDAVLAFYSDTLPQLGWRRASETAWQRGGERLNLGFQDGPDGLTVQFSLAPR